MDRLMAMPECKRPYNSITQDGSNIEPTEEEMEAFKLKRRRTEDPMANYM